MGKEKEVNPIHSWRRKEKEKASKAKRKERNEKLSEIPAHRRDPAPLVSEIYRLSVLEHEGRLNSDMKQHKKRLLDQYHSIKKSRTLAGIETIELVEFDPEAYEESKLKQLQSKRRKMEQPSAPIQSNKSPESTFNDKSLPELPDGPCPTENELVALGLPPYSPFPYEPDPEEEDYNSENNDNFVVENQFEQSDENIDELEAQLMAEYEFFKQSIEEEPE